MKATVRVLAGSILVALSVVSASAVPIFGIGGTNNLVRFDSATPGTIVSSVTISGTVGGDLIVGLDFRPMNGKLYGLGSGSHLYIIDPATAVATQVGAGTFEILLNGSAFGFDFNPATDRIRVTSDTKQNFRLDPNTGLIVDGNSGVAGTQLDANLVYSGADVNAGQNPTVVGIAFSNNAAGQATTTQYGIDTGLNTLVTLNGNSGVLSTVGPLGVDPTAVLGFDIETGTGTARATMVVSGIPRLYTIDLASGTATLVGNIGASAGVVRAMTTSISGFTASFTNATTVVFTGSGGASSIVFDVSAGALRHNRFSAGDAGFTSDFDFDSVAPGTTPLSGNDPAITIIVNAGAGDDQIVIGTDTVPASGVATSFQINGQGGGDSLTINDSGSATPRTINVDGGTSTITGLGGTKTYGTLESIDVLAGSGMDTINISGTATAITSLNAGAGDDIVNFANGATLSGGLLDGGSGTNTVDYSAYTTGVTVNLNETQTLFLSVLSGMQEPGPLSSSPASGRGVFVLSADQSQLSFNIAYNGITGAPISGTHFHNQIIGVNGPIVRGLFASEQNGLTTPSGTFSGVWSNSDPTLDPPAVDAPIRPLNAPSPVTPGSSLLQELLANRIYFNIHTLPNFPSGEIRGQLINKGTVGIATGTGGIRAFNNATGGSGPDVLTGNNNVNVLRGGGNNDTLSGGPGADQLFGGDGVDNLVGGPGGDQINGEAGDDFLVWNNGDGSDVIEGGAGTDTLQINGSPTGGDQFLIQVNPADSSRLRFDRTNLGLFNLNIGTIEELEFNTMDGDDTATVDFVGGNPIPSGGIHFVGGMGSDRLILQRSAGSFVAGIIVHTAVGPGSGSVNVDGRPISYIGLEPVDDTVPATSFAFFAPSSAPKLQVVNGPNITGFATTQINDGGTGTFELVNFANKTNATVNTGSVGQTLVVNNSAAPPGLTNFTINASPLEDSINIMGVPPGVVTTVNPLGNNDSIAVAGAGVAAGGTLFLDNNPGFDNLLYDSGGVGIGRSAGPNPGQTTITRAGSGTFIYQNIEEVIFDGIARALNISTRLRVLPGDNALIGGFIIPGNTSKKVIVRAIGPSLSQFGLTGLLNDPTLELYDSTGLIASNDNWRESQEMVIANSGVPPHDDLESAVVATLSPGAHTVVVRGKNNTSGIGVVEAFDLESQSPAQFANISTRGFVDAGDNVMIGGFILGGDTGTAHIAILGIGPSLVQVGIPNALPDPTLSLFDANGTLLIFNDNWMENSGQAAELTAAGLGPSNSAESGIFTTLSPGAFTAILAGKNGAIGVGIVQVYNLQ